MSSRCLLLVIALLQLAAASPANNMYCGDKECYSVLGVERRASKRDIARAYRKLSLKWHPDKHHASAGKEKAMAASKVFEQIGQAYSVLSSALSRRHYDQYLDHPDEAFKNTANYYRHAYAPTSNLFSVLGGLLLFCTGFQLLIQWQRWQKALKQYRRSPEVQQRAFDIWRTRVATRRAVVEDVGTGVEGSGGGGKGAQKRLVAASSSAPARSAAPLAGKAGRRAEKLASKAATLSAADFAELEEIVEKEVLPSVHVEGGYHRPGFWDLLPVQLVWLPFALGQWVQWNVSWWWRFSYRDEDYDYEASEYLTKRATGISKTQWSMMPIEGREELMRRALWVPANMEAAREEQRAEFERKHPAQYKRWVRHKRRYVPQFGC